MQVFPVKATGNETKVEYFLPTGCIFKLVGRKSHVCLGVAHDDNLIDGWLGHLQFPEMPGGQANSHCSTSKIFDLTEELLAIGQRKGNDWEDDRLCRLARRI
jgi:hypothetical protein